jgi:hypothetical protein
MDAGLLDFGHLGSVVSFDAPHIMLDGMVLIRVSHEKRFRKGTFLGLTSVREYERDLAAGGYFIQRSGVFLPAGIMIQVEVPEGAVRPDEGTAGAATYEHVGKEAHLVGDKPWRGIPSEIIDHYLAEGSSFVYSDSDGLLDPDTFAATDRIVLS